MTQIYSKIDIERHKKTHQNEIFFSFPFTKREEMRTFNKSLADKERCKQFVSILT